jgi:hypothetical protein
VCDSGRDLKRAEKVDQDIFLNLKIRRVKSKKSVRVELIQKISAGELYVVSVS